ncbi:MAG TPA: hypothetical protein VF414_03375 [Thermoanaerobaculia bacterium]
MRRLVFVVLLCSLLLPAYRATAEIGTIDDVPAATLLLPYFEVDLKGPQGITTLFSINNASATAIVAHVTFWTDKSIPTLDFDVYLTGYDVVTINIRDIFNGILPRTADDANDPTDQISHQGILSQDLNFPGVTGPCGAPGTLYNPFPTPTLTTAFLNNHLRPAHTGGPSTAVFGGRCAAAFYGDNIARGYVTVDTVNSCNLSFVADPGYATTILAFQNVLWGDYFYVSPEQNFAQGETLVHIEACAPGNGYLGYVGNGAGLCPFATGDYTFYGRYASVAGNDQREPLATTFASRFANGGAFDGGTDLIVWRDAKTQPTGANGPYNCATGEVAWFPLGQTDVVAFDEEENPTDLCFQGDNVSPALGGADACFPLETQRVFVEGGNVIADDMGVPYEFGWLYLNLNHAITGDPFPGVAQAWVTTVMDADGRFSVGYDAIQLDNTLETTPGGVLLIP